MTIAELLASPWFVAGLFFIVAFVYSIVGLGGGSSYTALMAILGFNALAIPLISLSLNLIVTSIGSFNFIRNKHANWRLILPFLITSMPMAYLGGSLNLPKMVFYWLLLVSLLFVAARIYLWRDTTVHLNLSSRGRLLIALMAGSLLGLIAGIVGIGGGIYLVPLIIILGLGSGQQAAACGAIFVWLNSAAGLASRLQFNSIELGNYLPLIIAVIIGGGLGSYMGSTRFSTQKMEKFLGLIILVAIFFLTRKLLFT